MNALYDMELALAHYKLEDLYRESKKHQMIKEAKQQQRSRRLSEQAKQINQEQASTTSQPGYNSNLHSA